MLNWIITFFILAIIAGVFGFWGLAGTFAQVAQFLAFVFVLLFVVALVYNLVSGRRAIPPL